MATLLILDRRKGVIFTNIASGGIFNYHHTTLRQLTTQILAHNEKGVSYEMQEKSDTPCKINLSGPYTNVRQYTDFSRYTGRLKSLE